MDWFRLFADLVPKPLKPSVRWLWLSWYRGKVLLRTLPNSSRPHRLPGQLIVSLTSYPARFSTLHLTLRSLLTQSVNSDRLLLWIAHDDMKIIPGAVRALEQFGLEIRSCDDLRSYKKLIPALQSFPDAFIVTADDDLYYPPDWLDGLVAAVDPAKPAILGRRVVRLVRSAEGRLAPFLEWELDVLDGRARVPSPDIMCESGAGALFPPHSLHEMVTNRSLFEKVCPDGDDLWFYWCARMAGTLHKKVGTKMRLVGWPGTDATSLWINSNKLGGNDRMIRALEAEFGTDMLGLGNMRPD